MPPNALEKALNANMTAERFPLSSFLYTLPMYTLTEGIRPLSKNPMSNRHAYKPCQF